MIYLYRTTYENENEFRLSEVARHRPDRAGPRATDYPGLLMDVPAQLGVCGGVEMLHFLALVSGFAARRRRPVSARWPPVGGFRVVDADGQRRPTSPVDRSGSTTMCVRIVGW